MNDQSNPPSPADPDDAVGPTSVDDLVEAVDDPASDKRTTGAEQAAANREDEPPA